jgi:hypothetical protein
MIEVDRQPEPCDSGHMELRLTPNFVDGMGRLRGMVQAFLIMIDGQTIIVDPGVGNGKRRTAVPGWDNLRTDFLGRLQAAGGQRDHRVKRTIGGDYR